jgi:UDP-N-acetylmuramate: L-alanyl-gamma-D-glutamyl-meso-diaminopimelate ligase
MRVHFIAVGGSAMHNLAIALHLKGYEVTGSDDEIVEPSKGRLAKHGLLPAQEGWNEERIDAGLDAVILGMHARKDNPELLRAQALGLKVYSYPEYIYEQSKDKIRVVIGGSHGKTTITSMILHVLKSQGMDFDYMVGAQLEGFETMVKLTADAPVIILEGDEYLASPIDRRPKFHLYHANIALLSGIAWDHINVFPTFASYLEQFRIFLDTITDGGKVIYCEEDEELQNLVRHYPESRVEKQAYGLPESVTRNGQTSLMYRQKEFPLEIFGHHNLLNLNGARAVCNALGIDDEAFYEAIQSFKGAARRLEVLKKTEYFAVYKDFAHSPSKLRATTAAVRDQFPGRVLVACMELHTFSSLDKNFLLEYKGSMDTADEAIVYFNSHTIEHKKLDPISLEQVKEAFARPDLQVYTDSAAMVAYLKQKHWKNANLLMMSSGNFDGTDLQALAQSLAG